MWLLKHCLHWFGFSLKSESRGESHPLITGAVVPAETQFGVCVSCRSEVAPMTECKYEPTVGSSRGLFLGCKGSERFRWVSQVLLRAWIFPCFASAPLACPLTVSCGASLGGQMPSPALPRPTPPVRAERMSAGSSAGFVGLLGKKSTQQRCRVAKQLYSVRFCA